MSKEVKTEAEVSEAIALDQEKAADEIFGSDEELSANAAADKAAEEAAAAGASEKTEEELAAEKEAADAEKAAADKGKTEEERAAEKAAADAEKTPEQLAAEKEAAEKAAKEEEEDPYKVPEDMKGRTRERFEKLTTTLRAKDELVSKQEGIIKGFREVIERTGMSAEEMQRTLDLGALLKSNPAKALATLKEVVSDLSEQLGEVPPGVDPLDKFPDLKQKVADREMSQDDAQELASLRVKREAEAKRLEREEAQRTQQQQTQQSQGDFQARVADARVKVATYLKTAEKDPDYQKIAPRLVDAATFAAQNLDPSKWLGYIEGEYKKIKNIAQELAPHSNTPAPLLDSGGARGGDKAPKDLTQLADVML